MLLYGKEVSWEVLSKVYLREYDSSAHQCPEYPSVCDILREIRDAVILFIEHWEQQLYLENGDRGTDDEDKDVCHGEVDEEHVDHSLEAGARGHWQDDLSVVKVFFVF